jgi:hypothetical protein
MRGMLSAARAQERRLQLVSRVDEDTWVSGPSLKHQAIQSAVPSVDAPIENEPGRFELFDHNVAGHAMSSAIRGDVIHSEERRQKPSRREIQNSPSAAGTQCPGKGSR